MGISVYNIKKWYRMLTGKSVLYVNQDIGKCFSIKEIKGYYNNLTEKVTKTPELLNTEKLPLLKIESGDEVEFPVAIFQYGLGAYDLFLQTGQDKYKIKFNQCCQWAMKHQKESGAWSNFFYIYPDHPYSAMCQGEGASLLLRAYVQTVDDACLCAAQRAIDLMIKPIETGGCMECQGHHMILREYTHLSAVMNGWIFALFGLYDFIKIPAISTSYQNVYQITLDTLKEYLPQYDNSYWSMYDLDGKIASPFYHNLHISQMEALYVMTGDRIFDEYARKWKIDQKSFWKRKVAFTKKVVQKIIE